MSQVDIPLLREAVEWAEAEAAKPPELCEWEQSAWVTTFDPDEEARWGAWGTSTTREKMDRAPACGTCYCIAGYVAVQVGGPGADFRGSASVTGALGITLEDGGRLFRADNSIEDVRRIAEEIAGERL